MERIERYIQTTIAQTSLLVLLAFVGLQLFFVFAAQFRDIGNGDYGFWQALHYVILQVPGEIYRQFPMIGLLGVLLGLSQLAGSQELIVMRASGVSIMQIITAVLKFSALVIFLVTLMGELGVPHWDNLADQQKEIALSGGQALNTQNGLWVKEGNNFIHVKSILNEDQLEGVSRFQFNDRNELQTASFAKKALFYGGSWHFQEVAESHISESGVTSQSFPQAEWNLSLRPRLLKIAALEPQDMRLDQLYETIHYRKANGLRSAAYELAFWTRIFQPLACLVMMWLAIPFIFGPLRSVTGGMRLVTGVCVGFAFYILNKFFGPLSLVFQFSPVLASFLPLSLVAIVGAFLVKQRG